jgi:pantoate--beta-alanine ligase
MRPDRAYFGQKDAQQVQVIRRLTEDLRFGIEIVTCPTVREADGLALSSRNAYLSQTERKAAQVLSRALREALEAFAAGERSRESLQKVMLTLIGREPLANAEYVSIADPGTLEEIDQIESTALASMAVRIGRTRLIDNVVLGAESCESLHIPAEYSIS